MMYMGNKNRIAKHILPIMLKEREGRTWVEPFVGGGNMIDKVDGVRIGADINPYLIAALLLIRDNVHRIPDVVTEDMYDVMRRSFDYPMKGLRGFVGFTMSFGGKWFGGYRRDKAGTNGCPINEYTQTQRAKKSAIKQSKLLQGVELVCSTYDNLDIPASSIIYCDPPYQGTTSYKDGFSHEAFWQWCRDKSKEGHKVFISEYSAPEDFECIWEMDVSSNLSKTKNSKKATEKLFIYRG